MNELSVFKIEKPLTCGKVFTGLLILVFFCTPAGAPGAQGGPQYGSEGARGAGMAFAATALLDEPWAVMNNPAAMPGSLTFTVFASPRPFGLPALARYGAAVTLPAAGGRVGAGCIRYGTELYRETSACLAWSGSIAEGISIGAGVHGLHVAIERYGSASAVSGDAGVLVRPLPGLIFAAAVSNLSLSRIGAGEGERLPVVLALGGSWQAGDNVLITADLVHDQRYPVSVRIGAEYRIHELLALRAGTASEPDLFTAGASFSHGGWTLHYAYAHHADLGPSHIAGIEFQPGGGLF